MGHAGFFDPLLPGSTRAVALLAFLLACAPPPEQPIPAGLSEALGDRLAWKERFAPENRRSAEAWGRSVWDAARVEGFGYRATERFACGGESHWIVITSHEKTGLEFALLPGGEFTIGSPEVEKERSDREGPQRKVRLKPFLLCRTEVTNGIYRKSMPDHRSGSFPLGGSEDIQYATLDGDTQPAVQIDWDRTKVWCKEQGLRLPSEAEWEYACRAGTTTSRFWGDREEEALRFANVADLKARRNWRPTFLREYEVLARYRGRFFDGNDGHAVSAPAGCFRPNAFGLFDMLGNAGEWCQDDWRYYYEDSVFPADGAAWTGGLPQRVFRGGSWRSGTREARSAARFDCEPDAFGATVGFRPARSVP